MGSCKRTSFLSGALAAVALLCAPTAVSASERAPYRPPLLQPFPPLVQQFEPGSRAIEIAPKSEESGRFALADAPAAVVLSGQRRMAPASEAETIDFAEAMVTADQRDLALALETWSKAPLTGPGSAERRRLRAAIAEFYAARAYLPLWLDAGEGDTAREAAASVTLRLHNASEDGLDLRAFQIPGADNGIASIEDELAISEAVAAFAEQASGGRIDPQRISHLIGARPSLPDTGDVLARVAAAGARAGDVLADYNPPHYGYQLLKEKLAELRSQSSRASASPELLASAGRDDESPAAAASRRKRAMQSRVSAARLEAEVISNMERWRWLPRDLGDNRIEVNIPEFELAVVRDGEVTHRARVIVGKEKTPTPIFSNAMQFIIVNPYWNVPPSILNKELLPQAGGDPTAIAERGFQVTYRHGKLSVRQPPGAKNALGRIKFMFPNDYSVYLHDTPSRNLFAASHRAFSHGCMRVDQPFALAEAVLGPESGWSEARVRKLVGSSERYINLDKPLPIHIEYFTAYVDEDGQLKLRDDLYGYSARVRNALGLGT
jgi:murein L,D-transpeptidase YcbB/YkuD